MLIKLNGKETEVRDNVTLNSLLDNMKINPQMVACEVNEQIVRSAKYPDTKLSPGDRVEILQMICGG